MRSDYHLDWVVTRCELCGDLTVNLLNFQMFGMDICDECGLVLEKCGLKADGSSPLKFQWVESPLHPLADIRR